MYALPLWYTRSMMKLFSIATLLLLLTLPWAGNAAVWVPTDADSMQWILQGKVTYTSPATVYDIDVFDNPAATVTSLHARQHHVICYIDVGSWEDWRPDAASFPKSVLGKTYPGYPNERFLDIRQIKLLTPIMLKRLDLCRSKGFDAVEPDNIDTYEDNTGFPLTGADEIAYIKFLIKAAHARGLSIGQKNDGDQAATLEPIMDWALTEECFFGEFCAQFERYETHHKRVFNTEYTNDTTRAAFLDDYCSENAKRYKFAMELKPVSLTSERVDCSGVVTK